MNLEEQAEVFATMAHAGQTRWDKKIAYINHPAQVVKILKGMGVNDKNMIASAWLHDVIEDTAYNVTSKQFNETIVKLCHELTHFKLDEDYTQYCGKMSRDAAVIKIADIMANITDLPPANLDKGVSAYADKRLRALQILIPKVILN